MADVATCGSEASTIIDSALARQPPGEVGWITTPTLALPRSMRRSLGVARVQYRMAKYWLFSMAEKLAPPRSLTGRTPPSGRA